MPIPPPPFAVPYRFVDTDDPARAEIYRDFEAVARYLDGAYAGPVFIATTTTLPLKPFVGMVVYETDTGLVKLWDGANWITQTNLRMFGAGFALSGSPPDVNLGVSAFQLQAGTLVATTDTFGNVALVFPFAFPNGLLTVVVSQGDITITDAIVDTTGGNVNGTTIVAYHGTTGAPVNGGLMRFNWMAVGW